MTQTEQQIEAYFYAKVSETFKAVIKGGIYRADMRPADSREEDIVVHFLSGRADTLQTGIVLVNIYTNDTPLPDGRFVRPFLRLGQIEERISDFLATFQDDWQVDLDETPYVEKIPDINQSCIVVRLRFARFTC